MKISKFAIPLMLAALGLLTVAPGVVHGQSINPQQLEQLKSLTPDQRAALVKAITNIDGNSVTDPKLDEQEAVLAPEVATMPKEAMSRGELIAGDTIVIRLTAPDDLAVRHNGLRNALGARMYKLGRDGVVDFPKVGRIALAGLTAEQVVLRLQSEPDLAEFDITASILPLAPTGAAALEPFGYSLFEGVPTTFAPVTDVPVPADYTIGVGDTINVQLFGSENVEWQLVVGRDGQVVLPNIGPVAVSGLRFQQLREKLATQIEKGSIGVDVSVSMGELRSIRVFVMGDVNRPGSYTVSSLSSMTNALFVSGGLLKSGSLRDVQLKRKNRVVGRLDLYDLLLNGNTRADAQLTSGDVIFVPPVGQRVSIAGQVLRPAVYEIKGERSLAELISLAGGLLPSALRSEARVVRFNDEGRKNILTVDLNDSKQYKLVAGDFVSVLPALDRVDNAVTLSGHVLREGQTEWSYNMRLSDLIPTPDSVADQADLDYVLIHRRTGPDKLSELISASLRLAWRNRGTSDDPVLTPMDEVMVFSIGNDRAERIRPILERIREQARLEVPAPVLTIGGPVRAPGKYPLEPGMRISDLIRAAGGLKENAYTGKAELTRQMLFDGGERRLTSHLDVDLESALSQKGEFDLVLQPYDFVTVREVPEWRQQQTIELVGEVRFPGVYTVRRGEFLSQVIGRAGGLSDQAFAEGSVFLRTELRERERDQLQQLAERVRKEISVLPADEESRSSGEQLLEQLQESRPQGRLVIDLLQLLEKPGNVSADILVKGGDRLLIPPRSQEVTVIGEIQYATSHIYTPNLDRQGYILKSGDVTANADVKRIYVVRANGDVVASSRSAWFGRSRGQYEIRPGDTIVVPLDSNQISPLSLWTGVTQIIYNIGVAAAAVASF
ncbi:MAG: SLBB domain-containing protein [Gammaproteobacteria bacterium]